MMLGEFTSVTDIEKNLAWAAGGAACTLCLGEVQGDESSHESPHLLLPFRLLRHGTWSTLPSPCSSPPKSLSYITHRTSVSPDGKFGFHVTTGDGKMAHTVDWEGSCAIFYHKTAPRCLLQD